MEVIKTIFAVIGIGATGFFTFMLIIEGIEKIESRKEKERRLEIQEIVNETLNFKIENKRPDTSTTL